MALTDFLTQIANSIRSKDGTTEPILATDFPQRIIDIPSGGIELPSNIKTGTFTVAEDIVETITIPHGLGAVPIMFFIFPDNPEYVIGNINYTFLGGMSLYETVYITNFNKEIATRARTFTISTDENNIVITPYAEQTTFKIRAGVIYRWFVWG